MSVIIMGMEMPKCCWMCPCSNKEFAFCEAVKQERYIPHTSTIPEWCPLVEVPDGHGRLIDADELFPIYADLMDGGDVKPVIPKAVIDVAPTIIGEDDE